MVRYATLVFLVLLAACSGDDEVRSYGACDGLGTSCPRGTSDPFEEVSNPDASDVDIIVADIHVTGLGYSAYVDDLCRDIAGQVIFYVPISNCESFTTLALHEVGHVLGLGHVGSDNIMNPDWGDGVTELQPGDIAGIQSIYGVR